MVRTPHSARLFWPFAVLFVLVFSCGGGGEGDLNQGALVGQPDGGAPPPVTSSAVPEVFLDLFANAERGHVQRGGPALVPGGPGWARVTQLADRGPWLPPHTLDERPVSTLSSIGGTLWFPVGEEGAALRRVSLWLKPVASGQRVSIFLDEKPMATLPVRKGMRAYELPLPVEGLTPGEHSLRFWFRFTRKRGKGRTPAILGPVRLLGDAPAPSLPPRWKGTLEAGGRRADALYAGAPARWSFYLVPPSGGRFFAHAAVAQGGPVTFTVLIEVDGEAAKVGQQTTVGPGETADVDVPLDAYAGKPVRLTLLTEGAEVPLEHAGWMEPLILMPGRARTETPEVRNVLIWAVDGLRGDRVGLGRGGDRAATPNLDLLASEGAAMVDVWSGGARAEDGHRRLLQPKQGAASLATLVSATGRTTGLLSGSAAFTEALTEGFDTHYDLRRAGEPPESRVLLQDLDAWLDARGKQPFFLYVASEDPRVTEQPPPPGYLQMYERARPLRGTGVERGAQRFRRDLLARYDARVSASDYWLGQVVALLHTHKLIDDTAVLVVGTVGQELGEHGGSGDGHALVPELLQVPLVLWHPKLRGRAIAKGITRGGDLVDVATTILHLVGAEPPAEWPGQDLGTTLLHGWPLPPQPSHARLRNQVAARYGRWALRGLGSRDLHLWNYDEDPMGRDDRGDTAPIALRALRDSMQD